MDGIAKAVRRYLLVRTIAGGVWAAAVVAAPLAVVAAGGQGEVSISWNFGGDHGG